MILTVFFHTFRNNVCVCVCVIRAAFGIHRHAIMDNGGTLLQGTIDDLQFSAVMTTTELMG